MRTCSCDSHDVSLFDIVRHDCATLQVFFSAYGTANSVDAACTKFPPALPDGKKAFFSIANATLSRDARPVSVYVSTCTISVYVRMHKYLCTKKNRMSGNGLKACAADSLKSNAATATDLYTEFKPGTCAGAYL